jgi:exonuclease SbcC
LESERLHVETTLSTVEKAATSYKHLSSQRKDVVREVERLRREISGREREIAELEKRSAKAQQAALLLAREGELTERLAHLKAEIARDEKFHQEVKGGLCPILSERCLNIGEDQTLEDYFAGQFATNTAQLGVLEKERAGVSVAVREAREAERHLSRLESVRQQLTNERELLGAREASLKRLDEELAGLPPSGQTRLTELRMQMLGIDGELKDVRDAALRYAELQPLQQRLREIEQEGKRRKEERASVAAAADALAGLERDIKETEDKLRALNDPRGRAASLRRDAEQESALRAEVAGAGDALRALELQSGALAAELEQYSQLDARWTEARDERDRTLDAHREYLANESLAAALPAREDAWKRVEEEAARLARESEESVRDYERASLAYNREQHQIERVAVAAAREQSAAMTAQLEAARRSESSLASELARLSEVRDRMREEFRAKERLEELNDATDFIRDVLKQAGPLVTESYLYNISIEANQLFREITGDADRSLRWSRDYEVLLEEEGHERSFQNLSGGEQMAAALSVRLALLKQLSDIRLAFFDEPTINMDAERRERLAQQIGEVKHFDQLFVISHDDTFEGNVDHIIHVERKNRDAIETAGDDE